MHLADPRDALAAHLAEGLGLAVHPHRHVVAADARQRARAFGHARRRVVRAARAEPRLALDIDTRLDRLALLRLDRRDARSDARAHIGRQIGSREAPRDRLRDQRRRQLVVRGQQPVAARHGPFAAFVVALVELAEDARAHVVAPVVQLLLQRVFENLALLFDDENLFEAGRERRARPARRAATRSPLSARACRSARRFHRRGRGRRAPGARRDTPCPR